MRTATALLAALFLAAPPAPAQPPNDDREFSYMFFAGFQLWGQTATGATAEPGELSASCTFGGPQSDGDNSVWYVFSPRATGTATLDTDGSDYDTILAVYDVDLSTELACNDDDPTNPSGDFTSRVENVAVAVNRLYYVRVTGWSGAEGQLYLSVASNEVQGPANDVAALDILTNGLRYGYTINATAEPGEPDASCVAFDGDNSVLWSHVAPAAGVVTVDLEGSDFDTVLAIYSWDGTNWQEVACNDDDPTNPSGDLTSRVEDLAVAGGEVLLLRVTGYSGAEGGVYLDFAFAPPTAAEPEAPPVVLRLEPPAPNPTAGAATLAFVLGAPMPVRLAVYDLLGREVAVLLDEARAAGRHAVAFDGRGLAAGRYVARLEAGGHAATQRLLLQR